MSKTTALAKPYQLTSQDKDCASWMINAGIDDMQRRLRDMTGTPRDIAVLELAISTEKQRADKRSSRLKPMEAALKRYGKSLAPLALTGESQAPNWDRARQILFGIKTALRVSLAGQVLLGQELQTIKVELGFAGSGRRKEKPHDAVFKGLNRTWEQWCKAELGISPDTADRFIDIHEAAKLRVKKLGGQPKLIALLESHPAKIDEEGHKLLSGMVDKLVNGETQKSLLEELKIVKANVALTGGANGKKPAAAPTAEQLAFTFFSPVSEKIADLTHKLGSIRIKQDYHLYLSQLPLVSTEPKQISLTSLEEAHEAALKDLAQVLADLRAMKDAKMKSETKAA